MFGLDAGPTARPLPYSRRSPRTERRWRFVNLEVQLTASRTSANDEIVRWPDLVSRSHSSRVLLIVNPLNVSLVIH